MNKDIKVSGISISIDLPKHPKNKLAILLPGYLDSKDYPHLKTLAEDLSEVGYTAIRLNPTGTWNSDGDIADYSLTRYLQDIDTVRDYCEKQNGKKYDEVIIIGHSFGGRVSTFYAVNHPEITKVVSIMTALNSSSSPYTSALLPQWKETGFRHSKRPLPEDLDKTKELIVPYSFEEDKNKYDFAEAVKKFQGQYLIIAGEKDEIAPATGVKKTYEAANEPKKFELINGISHDYYRYDPDVKKVNKAIINFLEREK